MTILTTIVPLILAWFMPAILPPPYGGLGFFGMIFTALAFGWYWTGKEMAYRDERRAFWAKVKRNVRNSNPKVIAAVNQAFDRFGSTKTR